MIDFNGLEFERRSYSLEVPSYTGERSLRDLPVVLLDYHPEKEKLLISLTQRGLLFKDLCLLKPGSTTIREYEGPCSVISEGQEKTIDVNGRIIIDHISYLGHNNSYLPGGLTPKRNMVRCACKQCTKINLANVEGSTAFALCSALILKFILKSKLWGQFSIDKLHSLVYFPAKPKGNLDQLPISDQSAQNLKAHISAHIARWKQHEAESFDDNIQSVSKGTLMVFQGPNGVGKMFAAETLAEYYGIPLLDVSVYDKDFEALISDAKRSLLGLARRWHALLVVTDGDVLLDTALGRSDLSHGALISTLLRALNHYSGLIILTTTQSNPLNKTIANQIRFVLKFDELSEADSLKILDMFMSHTSLKQSERSLVLESLKPVSIGQRLSGRQIRDAVEVASSTCKAESRNLRPSDIIRVFAAASKLEYELNLIKSDDIYTCSPCQSNSALDSELSNWPNKIWSVPQDGRIYLSFSKDHLSFIASNLGLNSVIQLRELLTSSGDFQVLDWGWPRGIWHPQTGIEYTMHHQATNDNPKGARVQWRDKNWTFGPHRRAQSQIFGKSWQRLLLYQNISTTREEHMDFRKFCHPDLPLLAVRDDIPSSFSLMADDHVILQRDCLTRNQFSINNHYIDREIGFHFTYFNMFFGDNSETTWPVGEFYDNPNSKFSKCSFTMLTLPGDGDIIDTDAWTILCMSDNGFWDQESYLTLKSPSLKCQSIHFIALALRSAAHRWRKLLIELEKTIGDGNAYLSRDVLQNSFFVEDDPYSNSRRYFWAIRVITEFIKALNNSIEQWKLYREARVEPFLEPKLDHFRDVENLGRSWYSVAAADKEASAACLELVGVKSNLEARLEEIKVMRDGLFNASAVIESQASTRLGENVKLLTYMTILFLPLAYCTSIWSINEAYGRARLACVSILVAFGTYFITFNLGGLVKVLRNAISLIYIPFKKKIEQDMIKNNEWHDTGKAFQTFRLNRQDKTPTEWFIPWFALEQALGSV